MTQLSKSITWPRIVRARLLEAKPLAASCAVQDLAHCYALVSISSDRIELSAFVEVDQLLLDAIFEDREFALIEAADEGLAAIGDG